MNDDVREGDLCNLYQEMPVLCMILDRELRIRAVNDYGCQQLGYRRDELLGRRYTDLSLPEERDFLEQNLREHLLGHACVRRWECTRIRRDGTRYWVRDTLRSIRRNNGEHLVLVAGEDITETRYLISELEHLSATDELTGLYNRRHFTPHLEQLLLSSGPGPDEKTHMLFLIDLDHFKAINDSLGHLCGDQLLRRVAEVLRKNTRSQDVLARLGGDEFGLILQSCTLEEATSIGRKLLRAIAETWVICDGRPLSVSATIGGALIQPSAAQDAKELLHQADAACYLAKERGRNRIELYDADNDLLSRRDHLQSWHARINAALADDRFLLHAQPIVPIRAVGEACPQREVLVRMQGDDGQPVLPDAFLPAAEYYHLAPRIDRWVIEKVVAHFLSAPEENRFRYFVNLSGATLSDADFIHSTTKLLPPYLREGLCICFEVTESTAIHNLEAALEFMERFKALGCDFALDDFGSGFSSFGYLRRLPVDLIKIDGQFIRHIARDTADQAVVMAIREMARVLGKRVIAEYVEDQAALDRLRGIGIDYAQGYHIGRPAPLFGDES